MDRLEYGSLVYDCDRVWDGPPVHWEGSLAQAAEGI